MDSQRMSRRDIQWLKKVLHTLIITQYFLSNNDSLCHRTLFSLIFSIHFDPTSLNITYPTFPSYVYLCYVSSSMPSRSQTDDKNKIQLVLPVTEQLVYCAINIPKQSCCGSSST